MRTASLSGDNSLRARRIRVNAAFPDETRKQCLTPKCSFSSDSKRSNSCWPRKIPQTPEIISLMPIGVAAAVGFFLYAFRDVWRGSLQTDVLSDAGTNNLRDDQRQLPPIKRGLLKPFRSRAFRVPQLAVKGDVMPVERRRCGAPLLLELVSSLASGRAAKVEYSIAVVAREFEHAQVQKHIRTQGCVFSKGRGPEIP